MLNINKNNEDDERDPDEDLFKEEKNDKKNEKNNEEEEYEENLSPLNEENDEIEDEYHDFLISQFEKVHRIKDRWKVIFKDVIINCNGKELIIDKISGELKRDW